jgi:hypothetical protein
VVPLQARSPNFVSYAFFDSSAGRSVRISEIQSAFQHIVRAQLRRLDACSCEDGCFLCLRTYPTLRYAEQANKMSALAILKVALGQGVRSVPLPPAPEPSIPPTSIEIVSGSGGFRFQVDGGTAEFVPHGPDFKTGLYDAYKQATSRVPRGSRIQLKCKREELLTLLEGTRARTDVVDRRLLFFELGRGGAVTRSE